MPTMRESTYCIEYSTAYVAEVDGLSQRWYCYSVVKCRGCGVVVRLTIHLLCFVLVPCPSPGLPLGPAISSFAL